jgi:ectoine hydroxylase-related dioxygenase (phytanoyl-CoA dioxygenase family)
MLGNRYIGLFAARNSFECSVCFVAQHDARKSVGKCFDRFLAGIRQRIRGGDRDHAGGSAMIFDSALWHGGGANESDDSRLAFSCAVK